MAKSFLGKFIPGRYIDLPGRLFPKSATKYNSQDDGEFIAIPPNMLNLAESAKSNQYGGRVSATAAGPNAKVHRNYQWLTYYPYRVTYSPISGLDVLTGFMSGCHVIVYKENGRTYVAHVGTADDVAKNTLTKDAWNMYAQSLNVDIIVGFNPISHWQNNWPPTQKDERTYCVALVTSNHDLYSIALCRQGSATVYRIADIVKMNSMTNMQLANL